MSEREGRENVSVSLISFLNAKWPFQTGLSSQSAQHGLMHT